MRTGSAARASQRGAQQVWIHTLGAASAALLLLGANGGGCSGGAPPDETGAPSSATAIRLDFAATGSDFYAAPFPSEHRRRPDGTIAMDGFPNPDNISLVNQIVNIAGSDARGFGTTSAVYFTLSGAIDPAGLPDVRQSTKEGSTVFLVSVDDEAPDAGRRYPVKVDFKADGGPFGAANLLAALPYQGVPLRPGTLYAAVVTTGLLDDKGEPLGPSSALEALAVGKAPEGMSEEAAALYQKAIVWLTTHGTPPKEMAGLAVFRTDDPTAGFKKVRDDVLSRPVPEPVTAFEPAEVFDDFCVYKTTIKMPTYQSGVPPYANKGGEWVFDDKGNPVVQAEEEANFVVTLPRAAMPSAGFPVVVFSRTGAGGERPLVDRGVRATAGGEAIAPGTGPAREFAKAGFAGSSIDGPHGGLRNVSKDDEQFLVFNFFNAVALRDNFRQSALELILQAHILESIQIDASTCPGLSTPGGGPAKFDVQTMAAFGHSMGASIMPLSVAFEPRLRAVILSGAGASYIENVLYKRKPLETKGFAEVLLKYAGSRELTETDPVMSLMQWAAEPSDPQVYARLILQEPVDSAEHHVMMVEGIVDNYILPPIANTTALSMGLDLAGPELDGQTEALKEFASFGSVKDLSGRAVIAFPAQGNVKRADGGASTAVVVQHPEDGVEDGHEAVFQTEAPKHQYRCFLQSLAKGAPRVPAGATGDAPCD